MSHAIAILGVVVILFVGFANARWDWWNRWRNPYANLMAVAVRFDPSSGNWNPIMRGGHRLVIDPHWGAGYLDQLGSAARQEEGEVAVQLWGRRKLYKGWFSKAWTGGPDEWTGKWVSIPTRGFGRPRSSKAT